MFFEDDVPCDDSVSSMADKFEQEIATSGSINAKRKLARLLAKGSDPPRALRLFTEVIDEDAEDDDVCELAFILRSGKGGDLNPKRAVQLYERAVANDPGSDASVYLAYMLIEGSEVDKDSDRAYLLLSDNLGDGLASFSEVKNMYRLAGVAQHRLSTHTSNHTFDLLYDVVFKSGNTVAMRSLAEEFRFGYRDIIAPDSKSALALLQHAISQFDDADSKLTLAELLLSGDAGVTTDPPRARELLEQLVASRGLAADFFSLAELLHRGRAGVQAEPQRASELYQKSFDADNTHFQACINLALIFGRDERRGRAIDLLEIAIGDDEDSDSNVQAICWEVSNSQDANPEILALIGELLKEAVHQSQNSFAMAGLARVLELGDARMKIDVPAAKSLYEDAIRANSDEYPEALRRLSNLVADTDGAKAVMLLQRAVRFEESCDDMCDLARLLCGGASKMQVDYGQAVELYERAIEIEGHFDAIVQLAFLLSMGPGDVKRDLVRATRLLDVAISSDEDVESNVKTVCKLASSQPHDDQKKSAFEFLTRIIDEQCGPVAIRTLAAAYATGNHGVTKDLRVAVKLYESAVEQHSDAAAMRLLASYLRSGYEDVAADIPRAITTLRTVIGLKESAVDLVELASILRTFSPDENTIKEAKSLYERAVDKYASFDAAVLLAYMLEMGSEIEGNGDLAFEILGKAIHEEGFQGYNVEEAFRMATISDDIPQDPKKCIALLSRVVETRGNLEALTSLGCMLETQREGLDTDFKTAMRLYEEVLEKGGDVEASHNLADILMKGRTGIPKDLPRAVTVLEDAVEKYERSDDMCNLAALLRSGLGGVEKNPSSAESLYRRAALMDENRRAIIHLAFMQESGTETKGNVSIPKALWSW